MAKTKKPTAKKAVRPPKPQAEPTRSSSEPIDPKKVHELFGLPGPYEPTKPPPPWPGSVTFWDCGISVNELRRKHRALFPNLDWLDGARFAKDSDSWKWRQINPTPVGLGLTFEDQRKKLPKDDEPPAARELVAYLVLHFLATGERLEVPRLRCKDVMPSGRRVVVGPFSESGLDIANVSDRWSSPGIGLCSIFTPPVPRKK
jgi:hypothetical protein